MPLTTHLQNPLPSPLFSSPFQSGITDPLWPENFPGHIVGSDVRDYLQQQIESGRMASFDVDELDFDHLQESYEADYAGRVSRQDFQSIMRADVLTDSQTELQQVLKLLSEFAVGEMAKSPSKKHVRILEAIPDSYRLTVTVGFGASLFVDKTGFDRFGLRAKKPRFLKQMPELPGDDESLDVEASASDLIIIISSDHPYINTAVVRFFAEYFNKHYHAWYSDSNEPSDVVRFGTVETGFARKDKREYLKFDDGIDNLHMGADDLKRLVYVDESDHEPEWCLHGSYLVYRKIRENMPIWEAFSDETQEGFIGRKKATGMPLSREKTGPDDLVPVFPDPLDAADGPLDAHIRKVQPRRPDPDLFGLDDQERRFLRRPYPFFDGLDESGQAINGLQFIAFMKSIQRQFEHVVNMWQMNPDFPKGGVGIDALFAKNVLSTIDGGYYFCPPGLTDADDYFGSGMFN